MSDGLPVQVFLAEPFTPLPRRTDWLLTRMFARHLVTADDRLWVVVEVARDGSFLAYRSSDEPRWCNPGYEDYQVFGPPLYRWFAGDVLIPEIQERWER